jgi:hypothetical protein
MPNRPDGAVYLRYDQPTELPAGVLPYSPYRLAITRARAGTVPLELQQPENVTGSPLTTLPDINYDFTLAPGALPSPRVVFPNNGEYNALPPLPLNRETTGFVLVGPPVTQSQAKIEFAPTDPTANNNNPIVPPWTSMITSPEPAAAPGPQQVSMAYTIPQGAMTEDQIGRQANYRHVVLLRRLANPYLPPNDPATPATYVNTLPPNPYITVDYMDWVPSHDAVGRFSNQQSRQPRTTTNRTGYTLPEERFSVGRVQPYTAQADPRDAQGGPPSDVLPPYSLAYSFPTSFVLRQLPNPAPRGGTSDTNHTFGRHNGRDIAAPVNATFQAGPPPVLAPVGETIMTPFDWLVHFDRPLINQLELLHLPAGKPHELTQLLIRPDPTNAVAGAVRKDFGLVPWLEYNPTTPRSNGLSRALGLLKVKPWGYGTPLGSKLHGLVNLNTAQHESILRAVLDPPAVTTPQGGTRLVTTDVDQIWYSLVGPNPATGPVAGMAYRTPAVRPLTLPNGTTVNVPVPGPTVHDLLPTDPLYATADRPFLPFGAPNFAPGSPTAFAGGSGIQDTVLRYGTATPLSPAAWVSLTDPSGQIDRNHSYFRAEAARKMLNNVTTVSDTFTVTFTVAFFEVRLNEGTTLPDPTLPRGAELRERGTDRYLLGKEVYKEVPGDLRQQFFAVIDRTNTTVARSVTKDAVTGVVTGESFGPGPRPCFTTLEAAPVRGALDTDPWTILVAAVSDTGTGSQPAIMADGVPVRIDVNQPLYIGVGAELEAVQVVSPPPTFASGVATLTVKPLTPTGKLKSHAIGTTVSNVAVGVSDLRSLPTTTVGTTGVALAVGNPGPVGSSSNPAPFDYGRYQHILPFVARVK